MAETAAARFELENDVQIETPMLIEGLPGVGMVAAIAVDQITSQLELDYVGHIESEAFPPVAAFHEGRIRYPVRVYDGSDPDVMTLQSDVPIPDQAIRPLSNCIHEDVAQEFDRAVFVAGAPADSQEELGHVAALATTNQMEDAIRTAGIDLIEETGAIGGITGGLVSNCYENAISATVLTVKCDPRLPDPNAAKAVIENALEPLVNFDIETDALTEQAQAIQTQKQQIAEQHQQMKEGQQGEPMQSQAMYQ